jgi:hypothetical protein
MTNLELVANLTSDERKERLLKFLVDDFIIHKIGITPGEFLNTLSEEEIIKQLIIHLDKEDEQRQMSKKEDSKDAAPLRIELSSSHDKKVLYNLAKEIYIKSLTHYGLDTNFVYLTKKCYDAAKTFMFESVQYTC